MSDMAGVLQGAGIVYPSRAPEFTTRFLLGSVLLIINISVLCGLS